MLVCNLRRQREGILARQRNKKMRCFHRASTRGFLIKGLELLSGRASSGWPELRHSNLPHLFPISFECRMYPFAYPSASTSKVQATEWPILKQNPSTFGWDMTQNVISPSVRSVGMRWDYTRTSWITYLLCILFLFSNIAEQSRTHFLC